MLSIHVCFFPLQTAFADGDCWLMYSPKEKKLHMVGNEILLPFLLPPHPRPPLHPQNTQTFFELHDAIWFFFLHRGAAIFFFSTNFYSKTSQSVRRITSWVEKAFECLHLKIHKSQNLMGVGWRLEGMKTEESHSCYRDIKNQHPHSFAFTFSLSLSFCFFLSLSVFHRSLCL